MMEPSLLKVLLTGFTVMNYHLILKLLLTGFAVMNYHLILKVLLTEFAVMNYHLILKDTSPQLFLTFITKLLI